MNTDHSVLMVDDQPRTRQSLRAFLLASFWIGKILEAENGLDAIRIALEGRSDFVIAETYASCGEWKPGNLRQHGSRGLGSHPGTCEWLGRSFCRSVRSNTLLDGRARSNRRPGVAACAHPGRSDHGFPAGGEPCPSFAGFYRWAPGR